VLAVFPAVACTKSWASVPITVPVPEVKALVRKVVPVGPVIVKAPAALEAPKLSTTIELAFLVVTAAALSLRPLEPLSRDDCTIGALVLTPV